MVQNVRALATFDLGVRTERLLTARLGLFDSQHPDAAARLRLIERLVESLRADPEVEAATVSTALPGILGPNLPILPDGVPTTEPAQFIGVASVDAGFADTYGSKLLAGRWIDARDRADTEPVAVVDTKFVARYVPEGEALGRRFRLSPADPAGLTVTIVGVVEALTLEDADDTPEPVMLLPQSQHTPYFASIALRTRGNPAAFKPRLVELMRSIEPDTPLYWVRTYDEVLAVANFGQDLLARIYGAFGVIALLLAAGGLYGVVGFGVQQRTREIGVRRALGASARAVLGVVLRRSAWQVGIGLAAGLALGLPFALALSSTMNGTLPIDARLWLLVAVLLAVVAAAATLVPARRALRVDPMHALRDE
jgi:predicted permease